jgi:hypothetical protein
MNAAGQVAFTSYVTGTTDGSNYGWFRSDGSSLVAIARAMQAAPGAGGAVFVNGPGGGSVPGSVAIGPGGQVAFSASLSGTPDGAANPAGLFLGDGTEIILVAISGQYLPDDLIGSYQGTVSGFFGIGPTSVNIYGQVAYQAGFSFGGTGNYVFTPVLHYRSTTSGNWDTSTNWTVSLKPALVHDVVIDPATSLTVTGPSADTTIKSLTVGTGSGSPKLALGSGKLTVNGLTIAAGSVLDVAHSQLTINYTGNSPVSTIRSYLVSGFNQGNWNGAGLDSSAAHSDASFLTALGYADNGSSISVKYTYYGDNNLDGVVNTSDFQMFLNGLAANGSSWAQGDYTYDGKVDIGNDFNLFLVSYLKQGAPLGDLSGIVAADAELSSSQKSQLLSLVPEPGIISPALAGALALLRRRRVKRRK